MTRESKPVLIFRRDVTRRITKQVEPLLNEEQGIKRRINSGSNVEGFGNRMQITGLISIGGMVNQLVLPHIEPELIADLLTVGSNEFPGMFAAKLQGITPEAIRESALRGARLGKAILEIDEEVTQVVVGDLHLPNGVVREIKGRTPWTKMLNDFRRNNRLKLDFSTD